MKNESNKGIYSYVFDLVKPFKIFLYTICLFSLWQAFEVNITQYIIRNIINKISASNAKTFKEISILVIYYFSVLITSFIFSRINNYVVIYKTIPIIKRNISSNAMRDFFMCNAAKNFTLNLHGFSNRIQSLMSDVPEFLTLLSDTFLKITLMTIIAIFFLSKQSVYLALFMFGYTAIFTLNAIYFANKISSLSGKTNINLHDMLKKINNIINYIFTIKFFTKVKHERNIFTKKTESLYQNEKTLSLIQIKMFFIQGVLLFVTHSCVFLWLTRSVLNKSINIGDFTLILGIFIVITDRIWNLGNSLSRFANITGRISESLLILNSLSLIDQNRSEYLDLSSPDSLIKNQENLIFYGSISFRGIHFDYDGIGGLEKIFNNLSFEIQAYQKVAFIGHFGSGKSSIIRLILKLIKINDGNIFIDNININDIEDDVLFKNIGYFSNDLGLINDTIYNNICYGLDEYCLIPDSKLNPTDHRDSNDNCHSALDSEFKSITNESVHEAAKKAKIHDFIMLLPNGYDTIINNESEFLSNGEKQLIVLARLFTKQCKILILENPSSYLDKQVESYIIESTMEHVKNKTLILVTNSINFLNKMDNIIVFQKGAIVEQGTHEELISKDDSLYKDIIKTI